MEPRIWWSSRPYEDGDRIGIANVEYRVSGGREVIGWTEDGVPIWQYALAPACSQCSSRETGWTLEFRGLTMKEVKDAVIRKYMDESHGDLTSAALALKIGRSTVFRHRERKSAGRPRTKAAAA